MKGNDYFLTCDDKLIRMLNNRVMFDGYKDIAIYNPIDFLREEIKINVIE